MYQKDILFLKRFNILLRVASVGLDRPWICIQIIMNQLLVAEQHMLWLHRSRWKWQSLSPRLHVKSLDSNAAVLFSFHWVRFYPAASLRFSFPRSSLRVKSRLQRKQLLATSSHLAMSLSVARMSFLRSSLKRRSVRPRALLPLGSSQYSVFGWEDFEVPLSYIK